MSVLEKVISYFAPNWAVKREVSRSQLVHARKYTGAQLKKQDKYWNPVTTDADSEILPDLPRLRSRSRDLVQNNPWANAIVENIVFSVVGHKGIIPQVIGGTPRQNEKYEKQFKAYLENPQRIDITGHQDGYELQALCLRQFLICGESFNRYTFDRANRPQDVLLQFLEPDQIWSNRAEHNKNEIRGGIEVDIKTGKHVSYFVNRHPGGYGFDSWKHKETRVLALDMCHVFDRKRPGQNRGAPLLAPVMEQLHDTGEYVTTEMVAARAAACLAVMIKRDHHADIAEDSGGDRIESLHPGMIARLKKGESIEVVEPKRPGSHFAPFTQFQIRAIATGANLAYETISRDYSQVNYSSARIAKLAERAYYRYLQQLIIKHFCAPLAHEFQTLQMLRGKISRGVFKVRWLAPGFEWVDPNKEIQGQLAAITANLKTKSSVVAELGGDYEEIIAQRKKEIELEKELEINAESGAKTPANKGVNQT